MQAKEWYTTNTILTNDGIFGLKSRPVYMYYLQFFPDKTKRD